MKKLTILILASLFCFGLFAAPKIPKTDNYLKARDSLSSDDCLVFVNNSGQNIYRIVAETKDNPTLWISNESVLTGIRIVLSINFSNENVMDNFINLYIDSYDLEKVFTMIRDSLISSEITPFIVEKETNKVKEVLYLISY